MKSLAILLSVDVDVKLVADCIQKLKTWFCGTCEIERETQSPHPCAPAAPIPLNVVTKYFKASVELVWLEGSIATPKDFGTPSGSPLVVDHLDTDALKRAEAIVCLHTLNLSSNTVVSEAGFFLEQLSLLLEGWGSSTNLNEEEQSLRLLAVTVDSAADTEVQEAVHQTLLNWALAHNFELLFPFNVNNAPLHSRAFLNRGEDAETETFDTSMSRVAEAFASHVWASADCTRIGQESLVPQLNGEYSSTPPHEASIGKALCSCRTEPSDLYNSTEAFEGLLCSLQRVRDTIASGKLSDTERRKTAMDAAEKFLDILDLDETDAEENASESSGI